MSTKTVWSGVHAAANFNARGNGREFGFELRIACSPRNDLAHEIGIEHRAQVSDASLANAARDHGRLIVEPAVRLSVAQKNVNVRRACRKLLGPKRSRPGAERSANRHSGIERVILLHAPA